METGATGNRRYNRIGSSSLQARVSDRRATEIAPSEAVAPGGSSDGSGSRGSQHESDDDAGHRDQQPYALAAETQLALLASLPETQQHMPPNLSADGPAQAYQRAHCESGEDRPATPAHRISRTI